MEFSSWELTVAKEIKELEIEISKFDVVRSSGEEVREMVEKVRRRRELKEILGGSLSEKLARVPWE